MDQQTTHGKLDLKISVTLKRLDQLLALLDGYKPVLEHNASCAAAEIKANFDGLIDALCQRQLSLLKQLDKVYKEKMTLIDSSKQTIEALRAGIMSCVSTRHANDSQIHDYIARSESVLLNSSSAPFVYFRAERSALPQAIANYGRVVSRYSGHFADPSQPSTSLPLAVEEEDNHEESHEHTTMFTHVSDACVCVKPHWRQWLFSATHDCSSPEAAKDEQHRLTCSMFSSSDITTQPRCSDPCPSNRKPWTPQSTANKGTDMSPTFSDLLGSNRTVTCKRHLMLQDFLRASGPSFRARSQTLNTEDSDNTAATTSDSFTILTGSANGRMDDLRDWLFCDPAELGDMPGLSTTLPSLRQKRFAASDQPTMEPVSSCSQLLPLPTNTQSSTITTTTSPSPLLPAHLLSSGPLDLTRWLHPQSELQSTITERDSDQYTQEHTDSPLERLADVSESQTPKHCRYAQCLGGPGGPTCCGARMQCFSAESDTAMETTSGASVDNHVQTSEPSDLPPRSSSDTPNSSMHPVVAQLNQIAATHWTKWIGNNTAQGVTVTSSASGIQSWLQSGTPTHTIPPPVQHDIEDFATFEDPVLPPKRRTTEKGEVTIAKESIMTVQSPFVSLADPVDNKVQPCSPRTCPHVLRKSASANANQTPVQVNHENKDDYEDWLLQKLSNLSTDALPVGVVDKWLTEHTAAPTVADGRPKLE